MKSYSELIKINSFIGRFNYLKLTANPFDETFGSKRILNQGFYQSPEWKRVRRDVILRDDSCDLGLKGYYIPDGSKILIHHIEPITKEDIKTQNFDKMLDLDNLISVSFKTHNALHYGGKDLVETIGLDRERRKGDTNLW